MFVFMVFFQVEEGKSCSLFVRSTLSGVVEEIIE